MKKIISMLLALIFIVSIPVSVSAVSLSEGTTALTNQFKFGEGPNADGYSVDYRYYSPVKKSDSTKYPLVIWLHGNKNGTYDGKQVYDIVNWSSSDFQKRFSPAGGAFILTPRSREELELNWDAEEMLPALKAAIDDFIAKNKANIDLSRIYIGGFSMGGMMALKVLAEAPEMFAAAFPYCPATYIFKSEAKKFKNVPVWLTASSQDPTVDFEYSQGTWNNIISASKVKGKCRFSTITDVCYPDGSAAASDHYAWFAVRYDMFTTKGKDYYNMSTVDGNGKKVTLTYPNGMISWLTAQTSDYGADDSSDSGSFFDKIMDFIRNTFYKFVSAIKNTIASIVI